MSAALALAAACSASLLYAYPPYVAPMTGDLAYLRLENLSTFGVGVTTFRSATDCRGQLMISDPDYAALKSDYLKIEANEPHTYSLAILGSLKICEPMPLIMFTPRSDRYYKISVAVDVDSRKCFVALSSDMTRAFQSAHEEHLTVMQGPPLGPVNSCHPPDS